MKKSYNIHYVNIFAIKYENMLIKGFSDLKEGEYQGHKYANYIVYGVDQNGKWCHEKVSKDVFQKAGMYDVNVLIGNEVEFLFNRFGKIVQVRIAE